jgi:hypothetical protein
MWKFIMAMCAAYSLSVGDAAARDNEMSGIRDAAMRLSFDDTYCAPVAKSLAELVELIISDMPAVARTQQAAAVSVLVTNHRAEFCQNTELSVRQIDK